MESESCGMRGKEGGGMNGRRLMPHGNRRRGRYLDDTAPRIFHCSPVSEFQLHMIWALCALTIQTLILNGPSRGTQPRSCVTSVIIYVKLKGLSANNKPPTHDGGRMLTFTSPSILLSYSHFHISPNHVTQRNLRIYTHPPFSYRHPSSVRGPTNR